MPPSASCGRCGRLRKRPGTCDVCQAEEARLRRLGDAALRASGDAERRRKARSTLAMLTGVANVPAPPVRRRVLVVDRAPRQEHLFVIDEAAPITEAMKDAITKILQEK